MSGVVSFQLQPTQKIDISLKRKQLTFSLPSGIFIGGGAPYEGEYTITPILDDDISLPTKGKVAKDNITVLQIPQYEVSNDAGGITFIIGKEVLTNG